MALALGLSLFAAGCKGCSKSTGNKAKQQPVATAEPTAAPEPTEPAPAPADPTAAPSDVPPVAVQRSAKRPHFKKGHLAAQFQKHGAEFGYKTKDEYQHGAVTLVSGGPGIETLAHGTDTYFYRAQGNEMAIITAEGVIKNYFKPKKGAVYWSRLKKKNAPGGAAPAPAPTGPAAPEPEENQ